MDTFPRYVSITGDIRGEAVLQHLIDPKHPKQAEELVLTMDGVTAADCFSAAVLRAAGEEHLEAVARGTVTIWPPSRTGVWSTVHALFGPLPRRFHLPNDAANPLLDRTVYLPTTRLDDMDAAKLASRYIRGSAPSAGVSPPEWRYLAAMLPGLAENALTAGSPCGAIVCGAVDTESGDARLAVVDLGDSISGSPDPPAALQACVQPSRDEFGGLAQLALLADINDLDVSILLRSGTGRSRWCRSDGWRHDIARFAPGFSVGISIHPDRPRSRPRPILATITAPPPSGGAE